MSLLSGFVVVAFALFLLGLAVVIYVRPSLAQRFLSGFASSAGAHYTEQALRLIIGGAIVVFSNEMWQSSAFELFGWVIVVTTVGLLLTPWRWHQGFARWVVPLVIRNMRLYGVGAATLGALLLYSVFSGAA